MASNAMRTYKKDESDERSKRVIFVKVKHARRVRNAFDGSRLPFASQSRLQDQFLHSTQTAESALATDWSLVTQSREERTSKTRKRMHDNHIRFSASKDCMINDVGPLHALELLYTVEPFLLHTRHVEHIRIGQYFVERIALMDGDTSFAGCRNNTFGHGEGGRRNKVEADGIEGEQSDETVYCSSVLEVADECDGTSIHSSEL